MSEAEKEARKEAERRWPTPDPHTGADLQPVDAARRQGFVAGSEWQASRAPQPTDDDQREPVVVVQAALDAERLRQIAEWLSMEHGHGETAKRVNLIADRHERLAAGFRRAPADPAVTEPVPVTIAARRAGKTQALIENLLAQANEHGIHVKVEYGNAVTDDHRPAPQPTDDDREALALAISEARSSRMTTEFDRGIADVVFDWMREQGFRRAPVEPAVRGEWEYGIRSEYDEIPLSELWPTFDLAQARVSNIRGGRWVIIRRRKAGPWEPVPRGADDE